MRLAQPKKIDKDRQKLARELLDVHARRRSEVNLHDGYYTKLFYDNGVPVADIAQAYGAPQSTVYAIIARQPFDCHETGQDCTTCGAVA